MSERDRERERGQEGGESRNDEYKGWIEKKRGRSVLKMWRNKIKKRGW